MNFNDLQAAESQVPWIFDDPGIGNTTAGGGILRSNFRAIHRLIVTQASTQEVRTLKDPQNAGVFITLTLYSTAGANCQINVASAINVAGNTHILLTAARQTVMLYSIPVPPTGTNNPPKYAWEVVFNDGASLS